MQRLRFSRYFKSIIILTDILVISVLFLIFFMRRSGSTHILDAFSEQNISSIVLLSLFWILLGVRTKLYNIPRNLTYTLYLERYFTQILIFLFGIILLGKVSNNPFIKTERFWLAGSLFIILFLLKSFIFFALKSARAHGINFRNVMFLGKTTDSREILENILKTRKDYGYKIFEYPHQEIQIEKLVEFWKEIGIYSIYLPLEDSGIPADLHDKILEEAERAKVRVALIPNLIQDDIFQYELTYIETQPVLMETKFPLDYFANYLIKRIADILFSLLVLIFICSWLFPLIAIIIKLDSKGPVFFKQKRYGYHDEVFNCLKFRTMVENNESTTKTTQVNDRRITKIGRLLRKTSLDETPQFINVLIGDMSVVGPRPHMLLVDDYYKPKIGKYSIRSLVKPGITGLAQVSGLRGDIGEMDIEMKKRVLADAFYVKNWSSVLDAVIVFKTIFLFVTGDKKAR